MRVAVIGQGSIGRRHAGTALELGHEAIVYDPEPSRQPPAGAVRVQDVDAALDRADAAVIASPSSEHAAGARHAIEHSVPVLVEKPLATDLAHAAELDCLARQCGVLLSVAMNLRHHPGVLALAALLGDGAAGRVLRVSAWCGSWLPGWRPGSDYRSGYSARRELGGGVLLDVAIHELDYLLWLVGPAASVSALSRRVSSLELTVEDVALLALELCSGAIADVVVDYLDRSYHRGCRIVGEEATLSWDWESELVSVLQVDGEAEQRSTPSDVGPAYRRQLERFLAAVHGETEATVQAAEARHVLAVIDAARVSSREGRRVPLAPPLVLRRGEREDSELLRAWRNDLETRRWSRVEDEVSVKEHARWFEGVLAHEATTLWIGETDSKPVGQVRVTRDEAGSAELHVAVAPDARGRGVGTALIIEAAARELANPSLETLVAHIKDGNEASRRAFEQAGFGPAGRDGTGLLRLERKPCR